MKNTIRLSLLAGAALSLAACNSVTFNNPLTSAPVTITPADVQSAAVTACGFQPTIDSVVNVETNNGTNAATAEAIAALICKAVAGGKHVAGKRLGGASVQGYVGKTPIAGSFVR